TNVWQLAILRFLVALGVGGEWAVAAALVAEVFPTKARARAAVIFHGTSVGGTWLATLAGLLVGTSWRYAYLLGVLPAVLVLLVFLSFGPGAGRLGRRGAFLLMRFGAVAIVPMSCYGPGGWGEMLAVLPVFGFFTGGFHAGYAVYFPELFPNHLRATGAGVCFNGGRLLAAPLLWLSGDLRAWVGLRQAVTLLSLLFLLGLVLLWFLPETKGRP